MDAIKAHLVTLLLPYIAGWLGSKAYDFIKRGLGNAPPQLHVALVSLYALLAPLALKWMPAFPQTLDGVNAQVVASVIMLIATQITHATKTPAPPVT